MTDRLATLTSHDRTLSSITLVQRDLAKITQQVSSGHKASAYDELDGVVERVSINNGKLGRIDNYISNNNAITTDLQMMDTSVAQIQKTMQELASSLTLRNSGSTSDQMNFQGIVQEKLDKLQASLNATSSGRYVFSGSKTDVPPVGTIVSLTKSGVPDSNYYQGNSEVLSARISDYRNINYGVTADEPSFQQAIAAVLTAKDADKANDPDLFAKAIDLVNKSITSLTGVRARIDTNMANIDSTNSEHETLKVYWKQAVAQDTDTDIAEASIKLNADQTVLQASYQVFALTSQLKLSDYLK